MHSSAWRCRVASGHVLHSCDEKFHSFFIARGVIYHVLEKPPGFMQLCEKLAQSTYTTPRTSKHATDTDWKMQRAWVSTQ